MPLESITCDLCGGDSLEEMFPSSISEGGLEPAIYYSSSRSLAGHLRIVRCLQCNLVFTNPRDDQATRLAIYRYLEDNTYESEIHNRQQTARNYLKHISKVCSPPGRLLDVGCSTGIFLGEAYNSGWEVQGNELSSWAVSLAQKRLPGSNIQTTSVELADFPEGTFNVITLWDVLEHVDSPTQTLNHIRPWLEPHGYLFLNLPNIESLAARWMGQSWVLLLREHLWYFSPATLCRLFEKTGFTLLETHPNFVHFSLNNIQARLSQYRGVLARIASGFLGRLPKKSLSISFPMGEMFVIARKRSD